LTQRRRAGAGLAALCSYRRGSPPDDQDAEDIAQEACVLLASLVGRQKIA